MKKTAWLAFCFLGFIWGSNFIFVKWAAEYITPAQITLLRVVNGTLKSDATVHNLTRDATERFGSLLVLQGKTQTPVTELKAGDIGAVAKLKDTHTNDTLAEKNAPVTFGPLQFAQPLLGWLGVPQGFQKLRVEERVEVLCRIVPEVHVDLGALDLVRQAAASAVKVILPLGHPRHGAALRDSFRVTQRAHAGQV